jgi:hypothetical protein
LLLRFVVLVTVPRLHVSTVPAALMEHVEDDAETSGPKTMLGTVGAT